MVSSMCRPRQPDHNSSSGCATRLLVTLLLLVTLAATMAAAQESEPAQRESPRAESSAASVGKFLAGGAIGLVTHEAGHLLFDAIFDADPVVRRVDFHGIPFFALTHRSGLPPRQELAISSAGFWVQHAESEWLLSRRPHLRDEHAPLAKGVLAFDVLASGAYAVAAFAKTGPAERDTRGIAESARIDERWVGAMILAPAVLDTIRYFRPGATWAKWASRGSKIGFVLLLFR
jgi:hypothetical protein